MCAYPNLYTKWLNNLLFQAVFSTCIGKTTRICNFSSSAWAELIVSLVSLKHCKNENIKLGMLNSICHPILLVYIGLKM